MTKILLIKPPMVDGSDYYELPLNLAYLAASLLRARHEVKIADLQLISWEGLSDLLLTNKFDLIGTTTYSYSLTVTERLLQHIRRVSPSVPIVLGGPHASFAPAQTLDRFSAATCLLRGESEDSLVALCNALDDGIAIEACAGLIPNLSIRGRLGRVGTEPPKSIDEIAPAFEAFHLFDLSASRRRNPFFPILASRGCVYKCTFCLSPIAWGKMRTRKWAHMKAELDWYVSHGLVQINFLDDVFSLLRRLSPPLIEYLRSHSITWGCETRLDDMTPDRISEYCSAGMRRIRISVETLNEDSLRLINKNPRECNISQRIKLLSQLCPDVQVSFMIGIPGETPDQIRATMDFAETLRPANCRFWAYSPLPGTPIYEEPFRHGVTKILPHTQYNPHYSYIETTTMTNCEINTLLAEAHERFEVPRVKHIAETGEIESHGN